MAREDGPEFVRWREEFLSQEKGSRVVHYYLEDAAGASHLAVVGTERSLRHMLYVVSEDFCSAQGCGILDDGQGLLARKWRSRREVVDWLASFLPAKTLASNFSKFGPHMSNDIGSDGYGESASFLCHNLGKASSSDIMWSGSFWICGKHLQHYRAFCRNGTTISTHSFVLVMSEEENRYLAYLEDMYEDKKGLKKVKVRWFHQNQEFACAIPPPPPHPCEVFITPYSQVISVECVDGIATVLTPEHYELCADTLPSCSLVGIRFCFRQYSKKKFKHFDLRTLRGYFNQATVSSLKVSPENEKKDGSDTIKLIKHCTPGKAKLSKQFERLYSKCLGTKICRGPQADFGPSYEKQSNKQSPGKHISVKFIGPQNRQMRTYNVGDKIEVLSQDSGIVGCWFRCTVLKSCTNHNKLKVQYDDLQNADDCGRLEERVPAFTVALPDKLGLRCPDRLRIRPRPEQNTSVDGAALLPGTAVDVWQFSGWWEGVVVSADTNSADMQIYFPGENFFGVCQPKDARISKDWVKNRWVDIERKPDVLSRVPSLGAQARQRDNMTSVGVLASSSSTTPDQELVALQANSSGDKETATDRQAEVSSIDKTNFSVEDEKQTILGKQPVIDGTEQDCKIGGRLTDKASASVEDEQQTISGKQPRHDDAEHDCKTGVSKASASAEGEQQTILSKGPRNDDAEQDCKTGVGLTDEASASVDDEQQTVLGKRPRGDEAEAKHDCKIGVGLTHKASASAEDKQQTILSKGPRNDDAEQDCKTGVSLTDKASSLVDGEQQIVLGKRPRGYEAEQDCKIGVILTHKASASAQDEQQTVLGKRPRGDDAEQDCKTAVSSTDKAASASVEDEQQTVLGKRPRGDDVEQDCKTGVGSTDKASASAEDEQQTVLGKRPREDESEQDCKTGVSSTDKASASVEDEQQRISGKRPREDAVALDCKTGVSLTDKASASVEDEQQRMLGKRPTDDDAALDCKTGLSLINEAFASVEDEAQTLLGNRSRGDDAEQNCETEVSFTDRSSALVDDEKNAVLGKQPRNDHAEQDCKTVVSLTDTASPPVEDERQTILGKGPWDDDEEQGCNGEVGVGVDIVK